MTARRAWAPALVLVLALAAAGCGGSKSLSGHRLRTEATRACAVATQRLDSVSTPRLPSEGAPFLRRGIAALHSELTALAGLYPDGDLAEEFNRAQTATRRELAALQSALKGLKAGNDPIVAFKTLQAQLGPLEKRATAAWLALQIPACVDT